MTAAAEKQRGSRALRVLLRLLGSALILYLVLRKVEVHAVLDALQSTSPWRVAAALGAFLGLHALSALKWRLYLAVAGCRPSLRSTYRAYAAGLFANLCLPSMVGGDVVRGAVLVRKGEKLAEVVAAGLSDRLSDLLALAIVASTAGLLSHGVFSRVDSSWLLLAWLPPAITVLGLIGWSLGSRLPFRRMPRPVARSLLKLLRVGARLLRRPRPALLGIGAGVFLQSAFILPNIAIGAGIGLDMPLAVWFLAWPLAKIAAMLPIAIGGIGLREAAFAALTSPFAPPRLGVAVSLIWQATLIVGGSLAGTWAFLVPDREASR